MPPDPTRARRLAPGVGSFAVFTAVCLAAALWLPGMPQPLAYHDFADHRAYFGVANFLDVASNLAFLLAGAAGIAVSLRARTRFEQPGERIPYAIFFAGMLFTAAGSAYYHLAPDNARLFWDRLPMTIAFTSLVAAQIADRVSVRAGLGVLAPMLVAGVVSVVYWRATEHAGAGNVMPYGVLQAYAGLVLALLVALLPSRYTRGRDLWWVLAAYALAKVVEHFDHEVLARAGVVSGHTLEHLAAAAAGAVVCRMLALRTSNARLTPFATA
jgi:hypothetical protein